MVPVPAQAGVGGVESCPHGGRGVRGVDAPVYASRPTARSKQMVVVMAPEATPDDIDRS